MFDNFVMLKMITTVLVKCTLSVKISSGYGSQTLFYYNKPLDYEIRSQWSQTKFLILHSKKYRNQIVKQRIYIQVAYGHWNIPFEVMDYGIKI